MMVREQGDALHLLSAVSPEWVGKGKTIRVSGAPTCFGKLSFTLESPDEDHAVLHLESAFDHPPSELWVHIPWFLSASGATADGVPVPVVDGALRLPAKAREVRLTWKHLSYPNMSYSRTVASYKQEYRRRYQHLMETGAMIGGPDSWRVPE